MKPKTDVYQIIADRIIAQLEAGAVPWHKPWAETGVPRSLTTKKPYRGINVFLLASMGYDSPWWLTWNQIKRLEGNVRKGEKACPVVFWKWHDRGAESEDGPEGKAVQGHPILRYYHVFNATQCDGMDDHIPPVEKDENEFSPIENADRIAGGMSNPPNLVHGYARACYAPSTDTVNMPRRPRFTSPDGYYATLFHELVHSTGHATRLARKGITEGTRFGSAEYSREELVAEMGAAFLCAHAGIDNATIDNAAAYIQGWLNRLRDDRRMVVVAAGQAQKAVDLILGRTDV